MLKIQNLATTIKGKLVLNGIDITVRPREIHAVMGPNGSGKSTLAYTLAGHPHYLVSSNSRAMLDKINLFDLSPDERAQAGLFLAFQYPVEVPGVKIQNFLRQAYQARFVNQPDRLFSRVIDFRTHLNKLACEFNVNPELLTRGLNEGFSGGEKKRLEVLQMAVLEPKYAILDETDSGLDIDAIKTVSEGVSKVVQNYQTGVILITHYQRILNFLKPDFVHILVNGKIVKSGGPDLAKKLEGTGYEEFQHQTL
jgi:Fe-S cluster assembly ATP-binding protein